MSSVIIHLFFMLLLQLSSARLTLTYSYVTSLCLVYRVVKNSLSSFFVLDKMAASASLSEANATFALALLKKLYFAIANKVRIGEEGVLKDILK